jgi:hypothetical protein
LSQTKYASTGELVFEADGSLVSIAEQAGLERERERGDLLTDSQAGRRIGRLDN